LILDGAGYYRAQAVKDKVKELRGKMDEFFRQTLIGSLIALYEHKIFY